MITIPKISDLDLKRLIEILPDQNSPQIVPVCIENQAQANFCFQNVEKKTKLSGGKQIFGWQIWKHKFMIEAEFHSVWLSPSKELIDITPKNINVQNILFIPDNITSYEGKQLNNIRLKTIENKLVDDFIALADCIYFILNKGERAEQTGIITLTKEESKIYKLMQFISNMIDSDQTINSICFCNQGKKYKDCHGKDLLSTLKEIIKL
jgi:hypothetical protein